MADSDDIDLDSGDSSEGGGSSKKRGGGGLGNLLPTILKFVAIGIGALIFIVTVSIITYNIMNKGGTKQTVVSDPLSPYQGTRPVFSYYDQIGSITTKTSDFPVSMSVTVDMVLGYDFNNQEATMELIGRRYELRDFVRQYFTSKTAVELTPEREAELKKEIQEILNTRFLDTAKVRLVLFNRLDVAQMY